MLLSLYRALLATLALSSLVACGGGSSSDGGSTTLPNPTVEPTVEPTAIPTALTGRFLDSAVGNISYVTETHSGTTNAAGEFTYEAGETVTFEIGGLALPATAAGAIITPLTIVGTDDTSDNAVVNIIRLLQTLDVDGDPSNGIMLSDALASNSTQLDFDVPVEDFASNSDVLDIITAGGQDVVPSGLVDADDAIAHLTSTLDGLAATADIVGVWRLSSRPEVHVGGSDAGIAVMLSNGDYYYIEVNEINDGDDWEYGTYSYTAGMLSFDAVLDLNDAIGPGGAELDITLDDDTFSFETDDTRESGDYIFSRVDTDANDIVGTWTFSGALEEKILFVFAADGTYMAVQPYEVDDDTGFEWGTYTVSEGLVTVSVQKDLGASLLADESSTVTFSASVDGSVMTVNIDDETVLLQRI
ncbi:hypothetical protein SAMN02745866_01374 [Alteromonadaceae bacterium Bs31]|nr:hypothetical protein SAMN02745866_01374 [Alteromonadaceae bacterium Bs31]